jgi:putative flippase GtrA
MNKLWTFVRTKFLTKKFLTFGIFGVVNTLIHMAIYYIAFNQFQLGEFTSNTFAFICASVFSYFANALFTFKPTHKNAAQFGAVMMVFFIRLLMSNGLTVLFSYIAQVWFLIDYSVESIYTLIAPMMASALLIPIAFFALGYVFKKTDIQT